MCLKQFFCDCIWNRKNEKFLYSERVRKVNFVSLVPGHEYKSYVEEEHHYVITYKCIKCDKEKIEEQIRYRKE